MISRRVALLSLIALPWAARARAQETPGQEGGDPAAPVAALNEALLAAMRAGHAAPFAQRYAVLEPAVERAFDLASILRTSVGLRWEQLPAEQQAVLLRVFTQFTVASYAANFDHYDGQTFEILPDRRTVGADQIVATKLVSGGAETRMDYVMHHTDAGWKAVDVLLDGSISRVAVQRSDFRSLLNAGTAEPLIRSLQEKVAQLSGGALPS